MTERDAAFLFLGSLLAMIVIGALLPAFWPSLIRFIDAHVLNPRINKEER
ncbi:MAG: hypothetical protein QN198_04315 [Armatimonadota bacterium]|nr:hypothetical protein [Armatimonadota bacterium]MDR5702807.1 hypothetical protein [Armatimonadota bacterium]MDR7435946.1 hypothetical protein [Armatimonadota bacterium]